jgi:hypothetical protein
MGKVRNVTVGQEVQEQTRQYLSSRHLRKWKFKLGAYHYSQQMKTLRVDLKKKLQTPTLSKSNSDFQYHTHVLI